MKSTTRTTLATIALASLACSSLAWSADKATPSSVDTQKHSAAIGNATDKAKKGTGQAMRDMGNEIDE